MTQPTPSPLQQAYGVIRKLESRLAAAEGAAREPIAILGAGCRFPGGAEDPDSYWRLLTSGRDAIVDVPPDRWDVDAWYDPDPNAPGRISTRRGGFLPSVDRFDAAFFGLSPREAARMDPQQRLLLEVSWEALERAGAADAAALSESRTGVFVGISQSDFFIEHLHGAPEAIDVYDGTGSGACFSAGRLAYFLGLQGPAVALDTACSSSLVAVHLACQSLRSGECALALAGGVNVMLSPGTAVFLSRAGALAPDGRCKTFDAGADGYGRAEGCGMVVLKLLSRALADGDPILAVIRGSGIGHDGRTSGLTVPNGRAQERLIREVLASVGLKATDIDHVEAHGTGTPLGDPIEVEALGAALCEGRPAEQPLWISSVKTVLGHLEPAAGIAGLLKVVLALQHGALPPHLHLSAPSPRIPWNELPVRVPTALTPWSPGQRPRRSGVSAFGLSGTNAHVILEEAPAAAPAAARPERPLHLLTLSARSPEALRGQAERLAAQLGEAPGLSAADVCHTAAVGRTAFAHRLALTGASGEDLRRGLEGWLADPTQAGCWQSVPEGTGRRPRVAFLFTGQGAQYPGMGAALARAQPVFREILERCAAVLDPELPRPLLSLLESSGDEGALDETAVTQPALFALEVALAGLWRAWGVEPDLVLGHSVGEFAAACVAGVFSLEDGLRLVAERGRRMQALPRGAMVAVDAPAERVEAALAPYRAVASISAINGPRQVVVSGEPEAVRAVASALSAEGIRTKALRVSHAFHSPMMDPALPHIERAAARIALQRPRTPLLANLTGAPAGAEIAAPAYWVRQAREPVQFARCLEALHADGCDVIIEIGPHPTLSAMARLALADDGRAWLTSLRRGSDDVRTLLESAGRLWTRGGTIDWRAFDAPYTRRKVVLPTYPFEHRRHWPERRARSGSGSAATAAARWTLLGERVVSPGLEAHFLSRLRPSRPAWLADHRVFERVVVPGAFHACAALAAAAELWGEAGGSVGSLAFPQALVLDADEAELHVVLGPEQDGRRSFEASTPAPEGGGFQRHARGTLIRSAAEGRAPAREAGVLPQLPGRRSPSDVYEGFAARGVQLGPRFRWISEVRVGEREALGRLVPPEGIQPSGAPLHPALLDACVQVFGHTVPETAADGAWVPLSIDRVSAYRTWEGAAWCHALGRPAPSGDASLWAGDLRLLDDAGQLIAQIEGLRLRRVAREELFADRSPPASTARLYEVAWTPVELGPGAPAEGAAWIVLGDAAGLGAQVIAELRRRGASAIALPADTPPEAAVQALQTSTPAEPSAAGGIVDLGALDAGGELPDAAERIAARALGHLQALAGTRWSRAPRLFWVTRGAQWLEGDTAPVAIAQASLWGLGRVAALEHPDRWGGLVDLDPQAPPSAQAEALAAALAGAEPQLALRAGGARAARLAPAGGSSRPAPSLSPDASYLVTGGLGDLGRRVAGWLVDRGARHLLLLGRSAPSAAAEGDLAALAARGAGVRVVQADVADRASLEQALRRATEGLPPLRGVVHAAGVLDDGVLLRQDAERLRRVFAPKLAGALHLDALAPGLELFVLFSSVAGVFGSPGQGNYAAANACLDALAAERRRRGEPALSVAWGPWAEIGMASRGGAAGAGVRPLAPARALELLDAALEHGSAQLTAFDADWALLGARLPERHRALVRDLVGEVAAPPAGTEPAWLAAARALPPAQRRERVQEHVASQIRRVLEAGAELRIGLRQSLFELGLDSMMAVELTRALGAAFGLQLPASLVFEYTHLEVLTDFLLKELGETAAPTPATPVASPAAPARDVAAMSDDEVLQSLLRSRS